MKYFRSTQWIQDVSFFVKQLWKALWLTDDRVLQVLVSLISIFLSITVGFLYAKDIAVTTTPILLWLSVVVICFAILYPFDRQSGFHFNRMWVGFTGLLLAAFFLRVITLSNFPVGFHVDEAGGADFSLQHVFNPINPGETISPFRTASYSQPSLYYYFLRLSLSIFGLTIPGARMSSVLVGTLAVGATFLMVNELDGRRTAWLAAILMTAYHYHIHWSRMALNNVWVTLFVPATLAFFMIGWRKNWSGGAVLAGLSLGLTAYFYSGGYIVIPLLFILIVRTWKQTNDHLTLTVYLGRMFVPALVVAAPLIIFAFLFPDFFFDRSREVFAWSSENIQSFSGDTSMYQASDGVNIYLAYFIYQLTHSLGAYNFFLEIPTFYFPHIPFLIGFASPLFLLGIAWTIYKKQYFPAIWVLIVTILGGFLLSAPPASSHFISVIPAICWLVAVPINLLFENRRAPWAYLILISILSLDIYFYFVTYKAHPSSNLDVPFPIVEPYNQ